MPYSLQALYQTVPTDPSNCFGTSVTIDDSDPDNPELEFRYVGEDAPDWVLDIALEEWPLLVEAVARLTAARRVEANTFSPEITRDFLDHICFDKDTAIEVLSGGKHRLGGAFTWSRTEQGRSYWEDRQTGKVELSDNDKALLQRWVDAVDYYEKNNA
jgi:hypothetical protein